MQTNPPLILYFCKIAPNLLWQPDLPWLTQSCLYSYTALPRLPLEPACPSSGHGLTPHSPEFALPAQLLGIPRKNKKMNMPRQHQLLSLPCGELLCSCHQKAEKTPKQSHLTQWRRLLNPGSQRLLNVRDLRTLLLLTAQGFLETTRESTDSDKTLPRLENRLWTLQPIAFTPLNWMHSYRFAPLVWYTCHVWLSSYEWVSNNINRNHNRYHVMRTSYFPGMIPDALQIFPQFIQFSQPWEVGGIVSILPVRKSGTSETGWHCLKVTGLCFSSGPVSRPLARFPSTLLYIW